MLALLLGGGAVIWFLKDGTSGFSGETIAAYVNSWGIWGQFGIVGLMAAHSFVPIPPEFVAIAAGMCFGPVRGTLLTWAGAMIGVRLVPVIAFNLINYGAGLTNVSWWRFTWTTAIGILPLTFLMALLGDQMREPTFTDWMTLLAASIAIFAVVHLARRSGSGGTDA